MFFDPRTGRRSALAPRRAGHLCSRRPLPRRAVAGDARRSVVVQRRGAASAAAAEIGAAAGERSAAPGRGQRGCSCACTAGRAGAAQGVGLRSFYDSGPRRGTLRSGVGYQEEDARRLPGPSVTETGLTIRRGAAVMPQAAAAHRLPFLGDLADLGLRPGSSSPARSTASRWHGRWRRFVLAQRRDVRGRRASRARAGDAAPAPTGSRLRSGCASSPGNGQLRLPGRAAL